MANSAYEVQEQIGLPIKDLGKLYNMTAVEKRNL
jgi:hypothetical protein